MTLDARPLWYFFKEREKIRKRKEEGSPRPWTQDPILDQYRFCNVFRRDDRVTRWLWHNWYEPNGDHENLWFAAVVARQINWPETLAEMGFPTSWSPATAVEVLNRRKKSGQKVFTGAYIIAAGDKGIEKAPWVVYNVLNRVWQARSYVKPHPTDTLESAHARLKKFGGFGDFLAFEVVLDWHDMHYLRWAKDALTFAAAGPGAIRGLNRLFDRPVNVYISGAQALAEMRQLAEIANNPAGPLAGHLPLPLELADIEGGLCEIDKYLRIQRDGVSREKYVPSTDPLPGTL